MSKDVIFYFFQNKMSGTDKTVHSQQNVIGDLAPVPTTVNPVSECEMDALLLGRIGVRLNFFVHYLIVPKECKKFKMPNSIVP